MAKEITIVSGKGGTGKTMVTSAFIDIAESVIAVDCDVDASNMHLLLHPTIKEKNDFRAGYLSVIDESRCTGCKKCHYECPFEAIDADINVAEIHCEGCGVCEYVCPENAVKLIDRISGHWFISKTKFGTLVHAQLLPGQSNTGKLISFIREKAKREAEKNNIRYIINDGPPGIGCPAISSITNSDMVLIVTEPTKSALHDLKRLVEMLSRFEFQIGIIVNKYSLNEMISVEIENFCVSNGIELVGRIPFDKNVIEILKQAMPVTQSDNAELKNVFIDLWKRVDDLMKKNNKKEVSYVE